MRKTHHRARSPPLPQAVLSPGEYWPYRLWRGSHHSRCENSAPRSPHPFPCSPQIHPCSPADTPRPGCTGASSFPHRVRLQVPVHFVPSMSPLHRFFLKSILPHNQNRDNIFSARFKKKQNIGLAPIARIDSFRYNRLDQTVEIFHVSTVGTGHKEGIAFLIN